MGGASVDIVQHLAGAHGRAFLEPARTHNTANLRADFRGLERGDPASQPERHLVLLRGDLDDPDLRGRRGRALRARGPAASGQERREAYQTSAGYHTI